MTSGSCHRPPGVFEFKNFSKGSEKLFEACVAAVKRGAIVIVGGGDTATLAARELKKHDLPETAISHISTGGGASLELLEGKVRYPFIAKQNPNLTPKSEQTLPGVKELSEK